MGGVLMIMLEPAICVLEYYMSTQRCACCSCPRAPMAGVAELLQSSA